MNKATELVERIRQLLGGFEVWSGGTVKPQLLKDKRWRVYCGDGQFDPRERNAAYARKNPHIALNFQINGREEEILAFEICVAWIVPGSSETTPPRPDMLSWTLMFHLDPERESWPTHPKHHIQFAAGSNPGAPPFTGWRLPFGDTDPVHLIEYLVARVAP